MVLAGFVPEPAIQSLGRQLPEDVAVAFVLRGEGGGAWTIVREGDRVRVDAVDADPVDCRLTCTVEDFRALVTGELDGRDGYLAGRLVITGDVGLVLGLQQAVVRAGA